MFGAIAGGIASALAGGAMSKLFGGGQKAASDRKSGSAGMPRPISYAVFCLKKKTITPVSANGVFIALAESADTLVNHYSWYFFFVTDPAPPDIYTLSLHDALPI